VLLQTSAGIQQQTVTGPDGRFTFETPPTSRHADRSRRRVRRGPEAGQRIGEIEITLRAAALLETVIVTPSETEQRLGDTPASVSLLTSTDSGSSPAVMADDVLRQVPSFSLFRRANSISAQPTTQGVSLRGIGPAVRAARWSCSTAFRSTIRFGGWVYWTRVAAHQRRSHRGHRRHRLESVRATTRWAV
jgi:hypothetical protein